MQKEILYLLVERFSLIMPFSPDTVTFMKVPDLAPSMKFLNAADEVVEEFLLVGFSRYKCNMLLEDRGFFKNTARHQEVEKELKLNSRAENDMTVSR